MNFFTRYFLISLLFLAAVPVLGQTFYYQSAAGNLKVEVFASNPCMDGATLRGGYLEIRILATDNGLPARVVNILGDLGAGTSFFGPATNVPVGSSLTFYDDGTVFVGTGPAFTANLPAGVYDFIIRNSTNTETISTLSPAVSAITLSTLSDITINQVSLSHNADCQLPLDGNVVASITGGSLDLIPATPPAEQTSPESSFTYSWTSDNGLLPPLTPLTGTWDGTTNLDLAALMGVPGLPGGDYTLLIEDNYSLCSETRTFSINDPSPDDSFTVGTTTPEICLEEDGEITLSDSEDNTILPGVVYEVYKNGNPTGIFANGTGSALTFAIPDTELDPAGTYTFTIRGVNGNCTPVFMAGGAGFVDIEVKPLPDYLDYTSAPGGICSDDAIGLNLGSLKDPLSVVATEFDITNINPNGLTATAGSPITDTGVPANEIADDAWRNTTTAPVDVIYTIVPVADDCDGDPFTVTITIYPEPVGDDDTDAVCSGDNAYTYDLINNIATLGNNFTAGVHFSWVATPNANVSGESVTPQTTATIADDLVNTSTGPVTVQVVTYTVTPFGPAPDNCSGQPFTVLVTVNPKPEGDDDTDEEVCSGDNTYSYDLVNNVATLGNNFTAGIHFSWVAANNPNVSGESLTTQTTATIGDDLVNTSTSPVADQVVTYTVTPLGPGPDNCAGQPFTVQVTVHPAPEGDDDTDEVCSDNFAFTYSLVNNIATLGNNYTTGVTFSWIAADNPNVTGESLTTQTTATIGDNLVNTSDPEVDEVVTYTVTPIGPAPDNCPGQPFTIQVTLHPRPDGDDDTDAVCSGDNTYTYDLINNIATLGNNFTAGVHFSWVATPNANVSGESLTTQTTATIGDDLVNTSTSPVADQVVIYTVTPFGPAPDNCPGQPFTVQVTVHPAPQGDDDTDEVCSNDFTYTYDLVNNVATLGNNFTTGLHFSWVAANNPNVSGESLTTQTTATIGDNLVNTGIPAVDQVVTYTVTPLGPAPDNCPGQPFTVQVTVHPAPEGDDDTDEVCSNNFAFTYSLVNNIATLGNNYTTGVTFSWIAADNPNVTGESVTLQTTATIADDLVNTSDPEVDQVVTYTVTPTGPGPDNCPGQPFTVQVTVHPRPEGANDTDEVCSNDNTYSYDLVNNVATLGNNFTTGLHFSWVATPNANVSGESVTPQTTATIADDLENTSIPAVDQIVTYTVTPFGPAPDNCPGQPFTVQVTVHPAPEGDDDTDEVCSDNFTFTYSLVNNIATLGNNYTTGVTFSWIAADNPNVTGESLTTQTTATIGDDLVNTSDPEVDEIVTYTVIPTGPGPDNCPGQPFTVQVTVHPRPDGDDDTDEVCSGDNTYTYSLVNNVATLGNNFVAGVHFSWVATPNANVTGESLTPQTTATIGDDLVNTSTGPVADQVVIYTVTPFGPAPDNCPGQPFTVQVTVHPAPEGDDDTDEVCSNDNTFSYDLVNNIATLGNNYTTGVTFSWIAANNPNVSGESLTTQTTATIGDDLENTSIPAVDQIVTYTVTPIGPAPDNCPGQPFTVQVTVHPAPEGDDDTDEVCSNNFAFTYSLVNNIATLGNNYTTGVTFSWIAADNPNVTGESLTTQTTATIGDDLVNTSDPEVDEVVTYTVIPTGPGPDNCPGQPFTVQVTVHPRPAGANDTDEVCSNDFTYTYDLINNVATLGNNFTTGLHFSWVATPNANVTGESLTTQTTATIGDNLVNTSIPAVDQIVTYTVTPLGPAPDNCPGQPFTVQVTVHPAPEGDDDTDEVCSDDFTFTYSLVNNIATLGNNYTTGVTFSWIAADNPNVSGESLTTQTTATIGDDLVNTSDPEVDEIVTYTVIPTGPGPDNCPGQPFTVQVTVHPRPDGDDDTDEVCSGDNTYTYSLVNNVATLGNNFVAGVHFSWVATPNANVTGESVTPQTTATIGDDLVNTSTGPVADQVVIYTVTPFGPAPDNCPGQPFTVQVTVHPAPEGDDDTDEVCSNDNTFSYDLVNNIATLGNNYTAGVTFSWVATPNANVSGESLTTQTTATIGDDLENTSVPGVDQIVTYTVTPIGPGPDNCPGQPFTVQVTVHPAPEGDDDTDEVCSNDNTYSYDLVNNIVTLGNNYTAGVTFSWIAADNPNVTGESLTTQTTATIGDDLVNTSDPEVDEVVTYTVIPTGPGPDNCPGQPFTVQVTVHPRPDGDDDTDEVCSGDNTYTYSLVNNVATLGNNFVTGVHFSWVATPNANVTGESVTPQVTSTIGDDLVNTSTSPAVDQVVTYTVTPFGPAPDNCPGQPFTVQVTVHPAPEGDDDTDEVCSNDNTYSYDLVNNIATLGNNYTTGVTFSWIAANNANVSGESLTTQTTATIGDDLVNTSNPEVDEIVTYTVTPIGPGPDNCPGQPFTVQVTVHPIPDGDDDTDEVCSNDFTYSYDLVNNVVTLGNNFVTGIHFSWVATPNANVSGESLTPQTTSTIGDDLVNTSTSPVADQVVTYTVTPLGPAPDNCPGQPFTVLVTVRPSPEGDDDTDEVCSNDNTYSYDLVNNVATLGNNYTTGITFNWVATPNANVSGESLTLQATSTISDDLVNTSVPGVDQIVTYTVTPIGPAPDNCAGQPFTVQVTVHPAPEGDDDTDEVCSGDNTYSYDLVNNIVTLGNNYTTGVTFSWVATPNANVSGESLTPQTTATIGDDLVNTSTSPVADQVVTYTVTPTGPGPDNCPGQPFTVQVTVHPSPEGDDDTDEVCSNDFTYSYDLVNNVVTLGNNFTTGLHFSWVATPNANVSGESLTPQTTSTIGDDLVNTSTSPVADQVVTYTVTPLGPGPDNCPGQPFTVQVTVRPSPEGDDDTDEVCSNDNTFSYDLVNNVATLGNNYTTGITFNWVATPNANVSGESLTLQATSTISDDLVNTSVPGVDQIVIYTVTPIGPAPDNCAGQPFTVQVTVHPAPEGDDDTDEVCSGDNTYSYDLVNNIATLGNNYTTGVTFSWVATPNANVSGESLTPQTTTTIGDDLVNTSTSPVADQVVTYTITPTGPGPDNCPGQPFTVQVTVHPAPEGDDDTDEVCSGDNTYTYDLINNVVTLGNNFVTGIHFSWVATPNANVSGESVTTQTTSTIGDNLVNTSTSPAVDQVVTYTVTPLGPAPDNCPGQPFTVLVTVHPAPEGDDDTDEVCSNDNTFSYDLVNNIATLGNNYTAGVTFSWVATPNANVSGESLTAQVTTTIGDDLVNTSVPAVDQVVTYTVTATGPGPDNCPGQPFLVQVTVHPAPEGDDDTDEVCSEDNTYSYDLVNNIATLGNNYTTGITFSWVATANANVTGESLTAQTTSTIGDDLVNTSVPAVDQVVTYTVTATGPGPDNCVGQPFTVLVTVHPKPQGDDDTDEEVCSSNLFSYSLQNNVNTLGNGVTGATFTWIAANNTNVTGESLTTQTTATISNTLVNISNPASDQVVVYTVIPSRNGCDGDPFTVEVTVHPSPVLALNQAKTICGNLPVAYEILLNPLNQPSNAVFSWPDPDGAGPATAGVNVPEGVAGTIHINDVLVNTTSAPIFVTYQVTPRVGLCAGTMRNVVITVNPAPVLVSSQTKTICSGERAEYEIQLSPAGQPAGSVFSWPDPDGTLGSATSRVNVAIGAPGTLHINDLLTNDDPSPILVRYAVTARSTFNCFTPVTNVDIIVNPGAVADAGSDRLLCPEDAVALSGTRISGLATVGSWNIVSGPAGHDGALSSTAPTSNPAAVEFTASVSGNYILELTTNDPAGSCPAVSDRVTIRVLNANDKLCKGGGGGGGNVNCTVFTATITENRPTCAGKDDGTITIRVTGGSPSPNYVLTLYDSARPTPLIFTKSVIVAPGVTQTFNQLSPSETYFYQIDDGTNVCRLPYSLPMLTTVDASLRPGSETNTVCFGNPSGSVIIDATGSGTGQYFYSVDAITWKNFVPGSLGQITDLPPLGTYNVLVGESVGDVCHAKVSVTINSANSEITASYNVTAATCNGADGAITNLSAGGGSGNGYQFSIDGGLNFQTGTSFGNLTGGAYTLKVRDGLGCEKDFSVNVTFPGFINATFALTNANCSNNGTSGSLTVDITDAGTFRVALSTDQFNEPADADYKNYLEPSVTFTNLSRDRYFVYMKSSAAVCPTRSAPITIGGAYALSFDLDPVCSGTDLSLSMTNIVGDPSGAFEVWVYEKFTNIVVKKIQPGAIPVTGSLFLSSADHAFLNVPDEYQLQMVQISPSAFCEIRSPLVDFTTPATLDVPLAHAEESYPDIPTGSIQFINFKGGTIAYDIRIEMDSAASPVLPFYETKWEEVALNNDQRYEKVYEHLPPGRYIVQVVDSFGCSVENIARVKMDKSIFVPNIFTPNDDGMNDEFFVRNLPQEGAKVKLVITSRWGKSVYTTDDYKNNWKGEGAADGVYFYKLQIEGADPVTGWVEILRGQKP